MAIVLIDQICSRLFGSFGAREDGFQNDQETMTRSDLQLSRWSRFCGK